MGVEMRLPRFDRQLAIEAMPAMLVSGVGLVSAGLVLELVEGWPVTSAHPTLLMLLPMLLGLKCNLEMTLASRLGTAFHTGVLGGSNFNKNNVFVSNMGVVQIQAVAVAAVSGLLAFIVSVLSGGTASLRSLLVLLFTSIVTSWADAVLLGLLTGLILVVSQRYNMDPDNLLGPLVASLGDLLAILVLGLSATVIDSFSTFSLFLVFAAFLALVLPFAYSLSGRDRRTAAVLRDGWTPYFLALCFSSVAGYFLESGMHTLERAGVMLISPLINGLGGNLASVVSSKQSSALHKKNDGDHQPKLFSAEVTVLAITIPLHLCFILPIAVFGGRTHLLDGAFLTAYLAGVFLQVVVLLIAADLLTSHGTRSYWPRYANPRGRSVAHGAQSG